MNRYIQANRRKWDELAPIHARTKFYSVGKFLRGKNSLRNIELAELGDVWGKSLLHLQCHFGMDTLSWAQLGAQVTGVDFSKNAIQIARRLARRLRIDANFVCCNIYDLSRNLSGCFDIIYTSYGVLCWLPDLRGWARVISRFLKHGGRFYVVDAHPIASEQSDHVMRYDENCSYAVAGRLHLKNKTAYEWCHSMDEIVSSLKSARLRIKFVHEFPFLMYRKDGSFKKRRDGWWYSSKSGGRPLMFSLMAMKPPVS